MASISHNKLVELHGAMSVEPFYTLATKASLSDYNKEGLVEFNDSIKDGKKVAVRLTDKGVASALNGVYASETNETPKQEATTMTEFTIEVGGGPTGIKRGGSARGSKYPFEQMEAPVTNGDGTYSYSQIFIAASEDMPDPAKSISAIVANVEKKYMQEVEGTRVNRKGNTVPNTVKHCEFVVRTVTEDGIKGARIWRVK